MGRPGTRRRQGHLCLRRHERDAQAKLRAQLVAADNGILAPAGKATVAAWLEEWLEASVEPRCRPTTVSSNRETIKRYILPAVGAKTLTKLQPRDVTRMMAGLTARGDLSPTTVRYAPAVLRVALGRALKQGKVVRNVCTLVVPPAKARRELQPLTAEQARALLDGTAGDPAADPPVPADRLHALYALAVATGMRQGELLALRWVDADLATGTLAVRHTLQRQTRALAEPKTDRARRTLRLGPAALSVLAHHKDREHLAVGRTWSENHYRLHVEDRDAARLAQRHSGPDRARSSAWGSSVSGFTIFGTRTRR